MSDEDKTNILRRVRMSEMYECSTCHGVLIALELTQPLWLHATLISTSADALGQGYV